MTKEEIEKEVEAAMPIKPNRFWWQYNERQLLVSFNCKHLKNPPSNRLDVDIHCWTDTPEDKVRKAIELAAAKVKCAVGPYL